MAADTPKPYAQDRRLGARFWPVSDRRFDAGPLEPPKARSVSQTGTRPAMTGANSPRSPGNRGGSGPFLGETLEPRWRILALR